MPLNGTLTIYEIGSVMIVNENDKVITVASYCLQNVFEFPNDDRGDDFKLFIEHIKSTWGVTVFVQTHYRMVIFFSFDRSDYMKIRTTADNNYPTPFIEDIVSEFVAKNTLKLELLL